MPKQMTLVISSHKLFIADVRLPRASWKAVPRPQAGSHETSVSKVEFGMIMCI